MKTVVMTLVAVACSTALCDIREDRLRDLGKICAFIPGDDLSEENTNPTPDDIVRNYNVTTNDVVEDLKEIVRRSDITATNFYAQVPRQSAVSWIGQYGTTNDLAYLAEIMTNSADYAQGSAVGASVAILKHSPLLIELAREIVTNDAVYSASVRRSVRCGLFGMCTEGESDAYINDPAQHARIAAFFLERAALDNEEPLGADAFACRLNPSYRHSQQRRNNLSTLRPAGLTGRRAELYDARQQDAAQTD